MHSCTNLGTSCCCRHQSLTARFDHNLTPSGQIPPRRRRTSLGWNLGDSNSNLSINLLICLSLVSFDGLARLMMVLRFVCVGVCVYVCICIVVVCVSFDGLMCACVIVTQEFVYVYDINIYAYIIIGLYLLHENAWDCAWCMCMYAYIHVYHNRASSCT